MQDISLAIKVDKRQVKDLKTLMGQVEKQVGSLNKVKVTLDTTRAQKNVEALSESLRQAEIVSNRFFGKGARSGIGAFARDIAGIRSEIADVRNGFDTAKDGATRTTKAVQLLTAQFKMLSAEGRAFAKGGADLFQAKGFDEASLKNRLKPLEDLPNSLAGTGEALKEIRFLLNFATENSKEFKTLIEAENNALAKQKKIRESMAFVTEVQRRATAPMPADPFGAKVPLLPAAGQSSGTFEIVERNREIARIRQGSLGVEREISKERSKQARAASQTASSDKTQKKQRGSKLNDMLLGAGFPLLFGGGAGAVGGSILGGAIGGTMGASFGGQIFGSAIGQTLENSLRLAVDIGNAVETLNLDSLEESGIRVNAELETQVQLLREAGEFRKAQELVQEKVAEQTGAQGTAMQDVANAFNLLGAAAKEFLSVSAAFLGMLTAPIAAALAGIIKIVNEIIKQANILFSLVGGALKKIALNEEALKGVGEQLKNVNGQFDESIVKAGDLARKLERERDLLAEVVVLESRKVDGQRLEDKIGNNIVDGHIKQTKLLARQKEEIKKINLQKNEQNIAEIESALLAKEFTHELQRHQVATAVNLKNRKLITSALEKADKNQQKINETLQEQIDKQLDQIAFEKEYAELIHSGSLPAAAKRALGLKQHLKELDRQFEKEVAILDTKIAQLQADTVQNNMTKEQLELLDELLEKREKLDKKQKDAQDAAKKAQGPKTDIKRLEEEMVSIQGRINELIDPVNQVIAAAGAIGDAFSESFKGVVSGSMTAQEALANLFQRTADHFLDMTAQIIAAAIKMQAVKFVTQIIGSIASAGVSSGASPGAVDPGVAIQDGGTFNLPGEIIQLGGPTQGTSPLNAIPAAEGAYWSGGFKAFNQGGMVSQPTLGLVGEGGEPEYIIPQSKMRESMARYSRGSRGSGVIPSDGGSSASGDGGTAVAAPIDVRYTVERINSVDYVTADQFQSGMQSAAAQGAQRGEQNTLKRLQMSGSTRRRLGM